MTHKLMCKTCGAVARYILDDGDMYCAGCYQKWPYGEEAARPAQPTACKVFSATRAWDREHLGERVTEWIRGNNVEVTEAFVAQSSDNAFHAITIVVFFREHG